MQDAQSHVAALILTLPMVGVNTSFIPVRRRFACFAYTCLTALPDAATMPYCPNPELQPVLLMGEATACRRGGTTMRQMTVLLVEDNPRDVRLIQRAFDKADVSHRLDIVHDGDEALTYLAESSVHTASSIAQRPDLILLDLNLPRMNGLDVLRECKQDRRFKQIPIVVLTTSGYDEDIRRAYAEGANAYLLKPVEFSRFIEIVHQLNHFWLNAVELPPETCCEEKTRCHD